MNEIFSRAERLLGSEMMETIARQRVIIFGVGGVGSWCAEGLVRSGIQHLTIVDSDRVSVSNINRQLMATTKTVGEVKVEALKARLHDINPEAEINALQEVYSKETREQFHLDDYDFIIDCIDSLKDKMDLLLYASEQKATVFSSMGAALKLDPTQIRVAEYWKVRGCPLGAALRKRMKRANVKPAKKIMCVYSEELLENKGKNMTTGGVASVWDTTKAQINGSLVHITAVFGFTLVGLVLQKIKEIGV